MFERKNYQAMGHIMCGTNASSAEPMFSVSSKIMGFTSHAHFLEVFCVFSLRYRTED